MTNDKFIYRLDLHRFFFFGLFRATYIILWLQLTLEHSFVVLTIWLFGCMDHLHADFFFFFFFFGCGCGMWKFLDQGQNLCHSGDPSLSSDSARSLSTVHKGTPTWRFKKCYSTTWSAVGWIQGCGIAGTERLWTWEWWAEDKLYSDFQLHRGLAPLTLQIVQGLSIFVFVFLSF